MIVEASKWSIETVIESSLLFLPLVVLQALTIFSRLEVWSK
jgi:hypothetical protein